MRVLVIAPHNDDETLGVGGAMAMYARQPPARIRGWRTKSKQRRLKRMPSLG